MTAAGDRHVQRLLHMLESGRDADAPYDPVARRNGLLQLASLAGSIGAPACTTEEFSLSSGVSGRIYRSATSDTPQPAMIYFHGGGFVAGGLDTHDGVCRRLALGSHRVVLSIAYGLAPEAVFPAAHDDARNAVSEIVREASALGLDPTRLALAGDSVGGGLAMAACLALATSSDIRFDRLGLMCPILDLHRDSPSRRLYGRGFFVEMDAVRRDFEVYCPDQAIRASAEASPLCAMDLTVLPPTIIHTAELDPFRDDGEDLAARLEARGRKTLLVRHDKMIHYFYALPGMIPSANAALDEFARAMSADPA